MEPEGVPKGRRKSKLFEASFLEAPEEPFGRFWRNRSGAHVHLSQGNVMSQRDPSFCTFLPTRFSKFVRVIFSKSSSTPCAFEPRKHDVPERPLFLHLFVDPLF